MKIHALIFCSILCITNTSHPMEIIKKIKAKKGHKQHTNNYKHPIITDLLVTQRMLENSIFPKDITTQIQQFCIQLRNKDFENSFPFLDTWDDFAIPRYYHYYLSPQQITCLQKYFSLKDTIINENRITICYSLERKDYKTIFITIPIEIRQYLTRLPQSYNQLALPSNIDVNGCKKLVTTGWGIRGPYRKIEFIIPEEH